MSIQKTLPVDLRGIWNEESRTDASTPLAKCLWDCHKGFLTTIFQSLLSWTVTEAVLEVWAVNRAFQPEVKLSFTMPRRSGWGLGTSAVCKEGLKLRARRQACCYQWGLKPAIAVHGRDFFLPLRPEVHCLLSPPSPGLCSCLFLLCLVSTLTAKQQPGDGVGRQPPRL